jgi:DMSO/TMAO reductase YedYZ molybdopterin-dependent catalytic subunit
MNAKISAESISTPSQRSEPSMARRFRLPFPPRREFLAAAGKTLLLAAGAGVARRLGAETKKLDVATGNSSEKIRGFPFEELNSFLTPTEKFYYRSHLEIPRIRPADYRLRVGGWVERPLTLSLAEIQALPGISRPVTFECTGTSVGGEMVSTGEWSGPLVGPLLDRARPKSGAVEVVMEGYDAGLDEFLPVPIQYARSVSLSLMRDVGAILALKMNGGPIPAVHGFPARVILPGIYGALHVKWISRLTVVNRPFRGFYQTQRYVNLQETPAGIQVQEIHRQRVKSQIARIEPAPEKGQGVYRVLGAAWSGGSGIGLVEVSTDGGRSWSAARMEPGRDPAAWVLFRYEWTPRPGTCEVVVRATDGRGRRQPAERDGSFLTGYVNNWWHRKELTVPG